MSSPYVDVTWVLNVHCISDNFTAHTCLKIRKYAKLHGVESSKLYVRVKVKHYDRIEICTKLLKTSTFKIY